MCCTKRQTMQRCLIRAVSMVYNSSLQQHVYRCVGVFCDVPRLLSSSLAYGWVNMRGVGAVQWELEERERDASGATQ